MAVVCLDWITLENPMSEVTVEDMIHLFAEEYFILV